MPPDDVDHEVELAQLAMQVDIDALERLVPTMDALAANDGRAASAVAALRNGLTAAFDDNLANALCAGAHAPADVASRFFRLRQRAHLLAELSSD